MRTRVNILSFSTLLTIIKITLSILVKLTKCNKTQDINILLWTHFSYLKLGYNSFVDRNCEFQNCYITDNVTHFADIRKFNVILFNAVNLDEIVILDFPSERFKEQLYILVNKEHPLNYIDTSDFNNKFNLTWSYRLDSNITWPIMAIKNVNQEILGPNTNMNWDVPYNAELHFKPYRKHFKSKNKAAAYMVTNCDAEKNDRTRYLVKLNNALLQYGYKIDKYSKCNKHEKEKCFILEESETNRMINRACDDLDCPSKMVSKSCEALIESDYYFHLVFEDIFADDYVSDSLLTALENFSVPVVFGGANYTRFMPDGAYINARSLSPKKLASKIVHLIRNKKAFIDMSKWRRYYKYYAPEIDPKTDPICKFCSYLNNINLTNEIHAYKNIGPWLSGYKRESNMYRNLHSFVGPDAENYEELKSRRSKVSVSDEIDLFKINSRTAYSFVGLETDYSVVNSAFSVNRLFENNTQISDLHNFTFLLNSHVCEDGKPLLFIRMIISATNHFQIRETLRDTLKHEVDFKVAFMLGETSNRIEAEAITHEHKVYGDIVQGNFNDVYRNLTYKHLMALHWATNFCPNAKYVLKTDDDVFVNTPLLKRVLHNLTENDDITCAVHTKGEVIREITNKHYVKESEFPETVYPPYCMGAFTIYNPKVLPQLVAAAKDIPYLFVDDVLVTGIIRESLNLRLKDIRHFYMTTENSTHYEFVTEHLGDTLFTDNCEMIDIKALSNILNKIYRNKSMSTEFVPFEEIVLNTTAKSFATERGEIHNIYKAVKEELALSTEFVPFEEKFGKAALSFATERVEKHKNHKAVKEVFSITSEIVSFKEKVVNTTVISIATERDENRKKNKAVKEVLSMVSEFVSFEGKDVYTTSLSNAIEKYEKHSDLNAEAEVLSTSMAAAAHTKTTSATKNKFVYDNTYIVANTNTLPDANTTTFLSYLQGLENANAGNKKDAYGLLKYRFLFPNLGYW